VTLARSKVVEAQKRGLFSRGFKAETRTEPALPDLVGSMLRKSALSYLSLAKKAGEAVAGFGKCEDLLKSGRARLVIHAKEAADDGRRKLSRYADENVEAIDVLSEAELDLALGRSHVVHAAVAKGGLADKLLAAARRVEVYETN
jgi:ribosomal protein L7Ae-like RNA K-turn-binding protein